MSSTAPSQAQDRLPTERTNVKGKEKEFTDLLQAKDARVVLKKRADVGKGSSSPVWAFFGVVFYLDQATDYAACYACSAVIKFKGSTKYLHGHLKQCKKDSLFNARMTTLLTSEEKKEFKRKALVVCATELRPFRMFEGPALLSLCQALIDAGANHGSLDIRSVLPKRKPLAKFTEKIYRAVKAKIVQELASVKLVSCTTDHWSDQYKHRQYLGLNIQYVLEGKVVNRALAVRLSTSKGCLETAEESYAILGEFGVPHSKVTAFVTDNALASAYDSLTPLQQKSRKRGIGAVYDAKWFACAAHDFNLLQTNMFDKNKDPLVTRIMRQLSLCKEIVQSYKRIGPEVTFKSDLKQHSDSRWDTRFFMLKSIMANWAQLVSCEHESIKPNVDHLDYNLLEKLTNYLEQCFKLRVFLSSHKNPSFDRLFPARATLLAARQFLVGPLTPLQSHFDQFVEEKVKITPYHKAASFLSPAFKNSKIFTLLDKEEAAKVICDVFDDLKAKGQIEDGSEQTKKPKSTMPSAMFNVLYGDDEEGDQGDSSIEDELIKYDLEAKEKNPQLWVDNLLEYWQDKQKVYPKLAAVAYFFMTIPATNNATERLFSTCRHTFAFNRTSLGVKRFEQLVFIKWNGDLCDDLDLLIAPVDTVGSTDDSSDDDDNEEEEETEEQEQENDIQNDDNSETDIATQYLESDEFYDDY